MEIKLDNGKGCGMKELSCNTCFWNNVCPMKGFGIHFLKIIKDDGTPEYIPIYVPACAEYREKKIK